MTTRTHPDRFALRTLPDRRAAEGVWWPRTRQLGDELTELVALWPSSEGRIVRVMYSPPDWDDHPRSAAIPGGRLKTGSFPRDDTHQLVLTMLGGRRRAITVIPPDTAPDVAAALIDGVAPAGARDADSSVWDNEGGHC